MLEIIQTLAIALTVAITGYQVINQRKEKSKEFEYQRLRQIHDKRNDLLSKSFQSLVDFHPTLESQFNDISTNIDKKIKDIIISKNTIDLEGDINIVDEDKKCIFENKLHRELLQQKIKVNKTYKEKCNFFIGELYIIYSLSQLGIPYDNDLLRIDELMTKCTSDYEYEKLKELKKNITNNIKKLKTECNKKYKSLVDETGNIYNNFYLELIKLKRIDEQYIKYRFESGFKKHEKCKTCVEQSNFTSNEDDDIKSLASCIMRMLEKYCVDKNRGE